MPIGVYERKPKVIPQLGEIRRVQKHKPNGIGNGYDDSIWHACESCGKERWVRFRKGVPAHLHCRNCKIKSNGGRSQSNGYFLVMLSQDDFFYPMAKQSSQKRLRGRYILEHRLVMAKHLGRCLHSWELVHHKNGVRTDNRIENLQLVMNDNHYGKIKCPFCQREFQIK